MPTCGSGILRPILWLASRNSLVRPLIHTGTLGAPRQDPRSPLSDSTGPDRLPGADAEVCVLQVRTKDVLFESISHLIDHHLQNGQPIVAAESELHLRGVVSREP